MDENINTGIRLAKLMLTTRVENACGQVLASKTAYALNFGHVPTFPGWPAILQEWGKLSDQQSSTSGDLRSKVKRATVVYAQALIQNKSTDIADGYIAMAEEFIESAVARRYGQINSSAEDPTEEICRYIDDLKSIKLTRAGLWLLNKSIGLSELIKRLSQTREVNTAIMLVAELSGDHAAPTILDADEDAVAFHVLESELNALVLNCLAKTGFSIISPMPSVDTLNGTFHQVTGDRPSSPNAVISRVLRLGLKNADRVVDKAEVEVLVSIQPFSGVDPAGLPEPGEKDDEEIGRSRLKPT